MCFVPETLIRTRSGLAPIASIQVGDEVLSKGGVYRRVTEVHENDYDGLLYEVQSRSLVEPIRVTPEHPFSVLVGKHVRESRITDRCRPGRCAKYGTGTMVGRWGTEEITHGFDWLEARTLAKGQFLATNFPQDDQLRDVASVSVPQWARGTQSRRGGVEFELTDDFLWMLGLYLAEGSASKRSINFALHQKEIEYVDRLERLFSRLGYTVSSYVKDGSQGVWVEVYTSTLAEWLPAWLGSGSHNKAFPAEIMDLPNTRLEKAVQGVLDGDSCKARSSLKQTSPVLALQVAEFFARTGNAVSLYGERTEGKKAAYVVNYEQKNDDKVTARSWRVGGTLVSEINDVRAVPYAGKVYNLSVAGHPSYTVQNLLVHNCGEQDAYDGAECVVCGFISPPDKFKDPDVDAHKMLDPRANGNLQGDDDLDAGDINGLEQSTSDQNRDGLDDATGEPVDANVADEEGAADQQPLLQCSNCGEQFEAGHPMSTDTADPQMGDEGSDGPADGDVCPACGKGLLESGSELAQQGEPAQGGDDAVPDEDPDPDADEEMADGGGRLRMGDPENPDGDPDEDDDPRAIPGGDPDIDDDVDQEDADQDDPDDDDDDDDQPSGPAKKKPFPPKA